MSVDPVSSAGATLAELEALRRENERLRLERSQDRSLLEAVLRHSPHGVLVVDTAGRLVLQNPAAERIWAGSATTTPVEDWGARRAFHPDGRPYASEDWPMERCLREGVTVEAVPFDILRFDGTRGHLVGSSAPIRDEAGRITGAISTFVDVSGLRAAEVENVHREHRYRQILDSVQDLVFCKDADLRVVYANRATCTYYRATEEELQGAPDDATNTEAYVRADRHVLATGETVEVDEEPTVAHDGSTRWFHTIKSPVRDSAGRIVEVVGVSRDVTERRRADRRLAAHHAITGLLAENDDLETVLAPLLRALRAGVDASVALFWRVGDDGRLTLAEGDADDAVRAFVETSRGWRFARGEGLPGRAWERSEPRWLAALDPSAGYCRADAASAVGLDCAIACPVAAGGETFGVLELSWRAPSRAPDDELLVTLRALGAQIGLFARRAREREQRSFLAQAAEMFAQSLDPTATLVDLTRLAVPRLGDWCAVDLLDADGHIRRLAVHHTDPGKVALAHALQERWPPDPDAPNGAPFVIRSGRSEMVPEFDLSLLAGSGIDPEQQAMLETLGIRSYVVVPLTSRGRVRGALSLVHAESGRRFNRNDLGFVEDLAHRAALALDNASLYVDTEASRRHLAALFAQAPAPLLVVRGPDHRVELANPAFAELVGERALLGRPLRSVLAEDWLGLLDGVERAHAADAGFVDSERPCRRDGQDFWFNLVYQPTRDGGGNQGVLVLLADVTQQVVARAREAEVQRALRRRAAQLALGASVGVAATAAPDLPTMLQQVCQALVDQLDVAFARIWTTDPTGTVLELQASAGIYTHLDGPHRQVPVGKFKIGRIAEQRAPHLTNDVPNDPWISNPEWARREQMVAFAGYPLLVDGRVIGVLAMFARHQLPDDTLDVLASVADTVAIATQRMRTEASLRDETQALDTLNQLGQALAAELDQDRLVQAITDSATRLSGAQFGAFFYNLDDDEGQRYTLYAISGVPRERFSQFPMPRNTAVFAPTFAGQGVVRSDDITKDPRYGHNAPYDGMPAGHLPVASYLAVPVVSRSGEVIGGLFFGHSRPGVFTERSERLLVGLAAQAAVAMDNARLFRESGKLIRALERSNADLDQFAYVASHDLKAPLRGIASLATWLEEDLAPVLVGEHREQMDLLKGRVVRMERLIDGILAYSRAGRTKAVVESVDTGALAREIAELVAPQAPATVEVVGEFPVLVTERVPLQQVLLNLVSNALKHAQKPDVRVTVHAEPRADDVLFRIRDDGVGIAPEYHQRIWGIFQTLAPRDKVESTGIGLALVKRIVEGRGGRVSIESAAGAGATFTFTWPRTSGPARQEP